MSRHIDPSTGLLTGDTDWFETLIQPSAAELRDALKPVVLSASGWRKIFASSGQEEDSSPSLRAADVWLAAAMALSFVKNLPSLSRKEYKSLCVAVAMDSRPTGTEIADAIIRTLLAHDVAVKYVFISAAPEIMAFSRANSEIDAFCYISASHNPIGHNGLKLGLNNGGVLSGPQILPLIQDLRVIVASEETPGLLSRLMRSVKSDSLSKVFESVAENKKAAFESYRRFSDMVVTASNSLEEAVKARLELAASFAKHPLGIVAELNGSARCLSIDKTYFESLGFKVRTVNDKVRKIAHRIIPEGESLEQCRTVLEELHKSDPSFQIGYVPDNDGDRGNVVYFDPRRNRAFALEAQEVFALCCLSELAALVRSGIFTYSSSGKLIQKAAVVVNDPTSMRIEEIAGAFGVEVFRAEVGEANVVNLAEEKRQAGYIVRILGEGSNGGNITYPSAVRDPLNTVVALARLVSLVEETGRSGIFQIWCEKRGIPYNPQFTIAEIIESLPFYATTSVSEPRALFPIFNTDHAKLKRAYELVFPEAWKTMASTLKTRFGIEEWTEINYEGTHERRGFGPGFRSGAERGGFKILLSDKHHLPIAFLWMRGSGTEPVFRVLVDLKNGSAADEAFLLDWHVSIIAKADAIASRE